MPIPSTLLVPLALMLTLVSCWFVPLRITALMAVMVVGFGLMVDVLDLITIPSLLLLAGSAWYLARQQGALWLRVIAGVIFIALSVALAVHRLPGFHNIQVLDQQVIKANSVPFSLFYNVDKPWIGLVIILSCIPLLRTTRDWRQAFRRVLLPVTVMLPVVFAVGLLAGFVRWQPAWPQFAVLFLLNNLLFTSLAEEAFFRGFIQKSLHEHWQHFSWGAGGALAVAALLFGLAHYAGGPVYMALATLAGGFYGWSYQRTGSIEMAIFSHWLLNACHFLFFTYPVVSS